MKDDKIGIVGLGYVGLPLAVEFGSSFEVIGFDINKNRISELLAGVDKTLEVDSQSIKNSKCLSFTSNIDDLKGCNILIITVPTPVDIHKTPDLSHLISASEMVGSILNRGDIVIYESTVFPGATEEICVPAIERVSELKYNKDFYCGYSPERINPGDKVNTLKNIVKVTSGSTPSIAKKIDSIYSKIIVAGTYQAPCIKVAEAAKVIENTQRDINIALINELSNIFEILNINTQDVLEAAQTKWNFLPFKPGLVGGHCIGVDPYYLTYKAIEVGYNPEMILAGRRINDNLPKRLVNRIVKLMIKKSIPVNKSKILIMGITFKENCPDVRNSKVFDIISEFQEFNSEINIYDPWVDLNDLSKEIRDLVVNKPNKSFYDCIVIAVSHNEFSKLSAAEIHSFGKNSHVVFDVKNTKSTDTFDGNL